MIPVTYNGTNWVKADKENANNNWYNYDKQMWANAVTIKDPSKRTEYKNATVGTTIDLSYVNLMLVWIPRYSYTLRQLYGYQIEGASTPSINTPGAFDIKFVRTSTTEMGSGKYSGEELTGYFTPSSFCWGNSCDDEKTRSNTENKELPGIWISKFELTGVISAITSLPNQTSIIKQSHSSFFNNIKSQINGDNGSTNYGLSGENYDTHMIKNTEWGAIVYLSQSKYGKYGNSKYTNANKEIYINNNVNYITGCSGGSPSASQSSSCQYTYNIETNGTGASTTGNIYGIYDTSGGAWERVMGNFNNGLKDSGFSQMPERGYYNLYTSSTGIKGDATNADGTAGFYGDDKVFAPSSFPWFDRGGHYNEGALAGIFTFSSDTGAAANTRHSSRLAISTW